MAKLVRETLYILAAKKTSHDLWFKYTAAIRPLRHAADAFLAGAMQIRLVRRGFFGGGGAWKIRWRAEFLHTITGY